MMPRFFFDIDDGQRSTRDADGCICSSREAVRDAAIRVLPGIASDELPTGDRRVYSVKVRDQNGRYVFHATLSLVADWLDEVGVNAVKAKS